MARRATAASSSFTRQGNFAFFYDNQDPSADSPPWDSHQSHLSRWAAMCWPYALNKGIPTGTTVQGANAEIKGRCVAGLYTTLAMRPVFPQYQ